MTLATEVTAVDVIMQYPFTQVREKLLMEQAVPAELVDEAIEEFRKYLILVAKGHPRIGMCSKHVDEVWHTFILFTKDYADFCEETFGFFLHHQPALRSRPISPASRQAFFDAYRAEFGMLPDIWTEAADCSPNTGGGGNECSPTPSCSGEPTPT